MFNVKTTAEIRHLNVRVETHGEDFVPAIDVKMLLKEVPVKRIDSMCPDIDKRFYEGDVVAVGEVNPLTVCHKLTNLRVEIDDVVIKGADIKKKAQIHLLPKKRANVLISVQTEHYDGLAQRIMGLLGADAEVKISERQLDVVDAAAQA